MLKLHLYLDDCGCCLIQGGDSYSIASSLCFVVSILSVFFFVLFYVIIYLFITLHASGSVITR